MKWVGRNPAQAVWAACFLWLMSVVQIIWSLLLFFFVGDILFLTGTDLVNAFVLLSGVTMLPINMHMLYSVAHGRTISHKDRVICCPLWLCILCSILINTTGLILCLQRMRTSARATHGAMKRAMESYSFAPDMKDVVDKIQLFLQCCGLDSYEDWYSGNWYRQAEDLDIEHNRLSRDTFYRGNSMDSVPFSCCKSGSCIASFLSELGSSSINTTGCAGLIYRIVVFSMVAHCLLFWSLILIEVLLVWFLVKSVSHSEHRYDRYDEMMTPEVKGIMPIKENFIHTSESRVGSVGTTFDGNSSRSKARPSLPPAPPDENVTLQLKQDIYKEAGLLEEF